MGYEKVEKEGGYTRQDGEVDMKLAEYGKDRDRDRLMRRRPIRGRECGTARVQMKRKNVNNFSGQENG